MQHIKIFHRDGLIYFDKFRVADLVLLKTEEENKSLLTIDINTFEGAYSTDEVTAIEKRFDTQLNPAQMEFANAVYEDHVELSSPDDIDGLEITKEDSNEKYLYFHWHVFLRDNRLTFKRNGPTVQLHWTATGDDAIHQHSEQATDNAVDIACELNFYVFTIDEWKAFAKTGSDRKEKHYHLLRTEITDETHPNLSELGRAQKAWDLAGQSANG
jgi:hypothetical protein